MQDLLNQHYVWLKAFHIISVVFWMAAMLYLPRLYVYHSTAEPGGELETALKTQERNLLKIIMNPASIAVWLFAVLMLWARPQLFGAGWFHIKLALVIGLTGLHHYYASAFKRFDRGERPRSERFWRIINEAPALTTIGVVILAVVKPFV